MSITEQSDDSNPLQRALDNYLIMEHERDAARHEAAEVRTTNAKLVAEVGMLREQLAGTEKDRRKWEATASTLLGRLLSINDVIGGAVKAAVRDGLTATEPGEADAVAAAATQCVGVGGGPNGAQKEKAAPTPSQAALGTIPEVDFGGQRQEFRR